MLLIYRKIQKLRYLGIQSCGPIFILHIQFDWYISDWGLVHNQFLWPDAPLQKTRGQTDFELDGLKHAHTVSKFQ